MKAEIYHVTSLQSLKNVITRITELDLTEAKKVTISDSGTKSSRQRGLQWIWYRDIANAGIGGKHEDTKEGVHLVSKWRFGVRILQRDDSDFSDLCDVGTKKYGCDPVRMLWFVDQHVSTEIFTTSQMAEFLKEVQNYYLAHGVNLTNPAFRGLLD